MSTGKQLNLNFVMALVAVLVWGAETLALVDIGHAAKGAELEWWIVRGSLLFQLVFVGLTIHSLQRVMDAKR